MPVLTNIADLQAPLGLANYYPVYINYKHDLCALFKWINEKEKIGIELKNAWKIPKE